MARSRHSRPGGIVWVLAASPDWGAERVPGYLPRPDVVIAADGGTALARTLDVTPDLVIGDLDSSVSSDIDRLSNAGVVTETYDHDTKLETDAELAVLSALDFSPRRIYVLGGTGARLDHTLANVLLLAHPRLQGRDVRLVDGAHEVYLALAGDWTGVDGSPGDTVTLLPVAADATDVTLEGLRYPLTAGVLPFGMGRGVSNLIVRDGARLRFAGGPLLVVITHTARP